MSEAADHHEADPNLARAFWRFEGAMGARMDSFDRELRDGLTEIRDAIDEQDGEGSELRARLILVESKQAIVYRILGALGLLVAGGLAELVRRALVGG